MALDLSKIKKKLAQLQTSTNKSAYIWKPPVGKTVIRIVPYQYDKDNCFIELYFHYNISKKNPLSLDTFHEDDPIVEFSEKLKNTGDTNDWKLGKKLEPKLRTYVPIIVRGKEKEGVKFWGFGKELYKEILNFITDPDYGDITDLEKGRDVTVEFISAKDAGNNYGELSIRVKPNTSPATTDSSVLEMINEKQVDIFDVYKKPTYSELEDILAAWLQPENAESQESETTEEDAESAETEETPDEVKEPVKNAPEKIVQKEKVETKIPEKTKVTPKNASNVGDAFKELFPD